VNTQKLDVRQCPACEGRGIVLETRATIAGARRRYGCTVCPRRWNTLEQPVDPTGGQGALLVTERARVQRELETAADAISLAASIITSQVAA
jgi:transcriptional regulator NrdR family protein